MRSRDHSDTPPRATVYSPRGKRGDNTQFTPYSYTMAHIRNRNTMNLKAIRVEESNSEDDQDFIGFKIGETIENRDWVDNQVGKLHALASPRTDNNNIKVVSVIKSISKKEHFIGFENYETIKNKLWTANKVCILRKEQRERELSLLKQEDSDDTGSHYSDNTDETAGPSKDNSDISVPIPLVPYEDSDNEIIFICEEDRRQEDNPQEDTENPITYSIRNEKTASGKSVIKCSKGHTYSFKKDGKGKKTGQQPIYKYFQCIKRQYKSKDKKEENCTARLRVEKFEEGENNMIVIPKGQPHNHDQSSSNSIKKEINTELRNLAIMFPKMEPKLIVNTVINKNENFKKFYEQNSKTIINSMKKTIYRARKPKKTLNDDDSD